MLFSLSFITLFENAQTPLGTYINGNKLSKSMRPLHEEEYSNGKDKTRIHIVEIDSENPEEIVKYGCFMILIPKNEFNNKIALEIFNECKNYDYKFVSKDNYHELFKTLINSIKGSHIFINNFGTTDVRIFKKIPKFIGTVYTW